MSRVDWDWHYVWRVLFMLIGPVVTIPFSSLLVAPLYIPFCLLVCVLTSTCAYHSITTNSTTFNSQCKQKEIFLSRDVTYGTTFFASLFHVSLVFWLTVAVDLSIMKIPVWSSNPYSVSSVKLHNSSSSCWIIYNSSIYDHTALIKAGTHPGGTQAITRRCGQNATLGYHNQPNHNPIFFTGQIHKISQVQENQDRFSSVIQRRLFLCLCYLVFTVMATFVFAFHDETAIENILKSREEQKNETGNKHRKDDHFALENYFLSGKVFDKNRLAYHGRHALDSSTIWQWWDGAHLISALHSLICLFLFQDEELPLFNFVIADFVINKHALLYAVSNFFILGQLTYILIETYMLYQNQILIASSFKNASIAALADVDTNTSSPLSHFTGDDKVFNWNSVKHARAWNILRKRIQDYDLPHVHGVQFSLGVLLFIGLCLIVPIILILGGAHFLMPVMSDNQRLSFLTRLSMDAFCVFLYLALIFQSASSLSDVYHSFKSVITTVKNTLIWRLYLCASTTETKTPSYLSSLSFSPSSFSSSLSSSSSSSSSSPSSSSFAGGADVDVVGDVLVSDSVPGVSCTRDFFDVLYGVVTDDIEEPTFLMMKVGTARQLVEVVVTGLSTYVFSMFWKEFEQHFDHLHSLVN